jgi:hypothetical protein
LAEWTASGRVLIACNCDWGCPCNFNAMPSRGFCQGGWCWFIEQGRFDGVTLDGLGVAVWAKWPGAIHHGNGQAIAFMDARANDAQRAALTQLVRGELGGPWGIFINTYALDGPHAAEFRVEHAEHESRLRIGDAVDLQLEVIRNPVSDAPAHPEIVLPEGLVVKRALVAKSRVFSVGHSLGYDHSGQYTAFGGFSYQGSSAA